MVKKLLAFIKYLIDMDDISKILKIPKKTPKILIVFDDMIVDMLSNRQLNPTVTELFMRRRKVIISVVFIT